MKVSIPTFARLYTVSAGLASVLSVVGCSLAPGGEKIDDAVTVAIATGIADRQSFNDKEAELLLRLPCDISIGAYFRLQNTVQQEALSMICSGRRSHESVPPLTSDASTHSKAGSH